jgi:Ca-activated chloride channel family protein
MRARVGAFVVVLILLTTFVAAQTGGIQGIARDPSGGVLPGVTVEVSSPALRESVRFATTNDKGEYRFVALPVGTYRVTFRLQAFATTVKEGIVVSANTALRVDGELRVAATGEVVPAATEAPAGDVQSARQKVLTGDQLQSLPTTRDAGNLVTLVPGLAPGSGGGRGGGGGGAGLARTESGAGANQGRLDGIAVGASAHEREADVYRSLPRYPSPPPRHAGEAYAPIHENPFRRVADDPLSTFSVDVDTASYANIRRFLGDGMLPPRDAVRVEEMINYFRFDYPQPRAKAPFSVTTEVVESPWTPGHRLALIGLQGRETFDDDRTARNLVFLIDVSGSMQPADKLPLVKNGLRMLADTLQARDRLAIVVYASHTGVVLPSTPGDHKAAIHRAIEGLQAGGSTNGGAGIQLAYQLARQQFVRGGVNRVVLATDGDFNVGVTSHAALLDLIEQERRSGVFLSVLGVGTGNLKDATMEMLADKGNGNYAYLDSIQEAQRVLVREASSTLETIAKDVKIQIEFNPQTVAAYRLIGYENRLLKAEEFDDDRKDAGEIGAGHSVTALYEIVPVGADMPAGTLDGLRYQPGRQPERAVSSGPYAEELMTVKLRYKEPEGDVSQLLTVPVRTKPQAMTANIGFASAVSELGMLLRGSRHADAAGYDGLILRARRFRGVDPDGYRAEFIKLAELARSLRALQGTR